ncbi:MAG: LysM peptidoglycan-binding domain-containing protein [Planctomycetota bacterium]|nr:LysM peptidoglycan-binding domain-containing protein [Planctomycetota bacterium]
MDKLRWTICSLIFIAGVIGITSKLSPDFDPILGRPSDVLVTPVSIKWNSADDQARELLAATSGHFSERVPVASEVQEPVTPASRQQQRPLASAPIEPEAVDADYDSWVVRRGDSLWKIAGEVLGDSRRMAEIVAANPRIDPDKLKEGQVLRVPRTVRREVIPRQESDSLVHTVRAGETLVSIARQHYGVPHWALIQSANTKLLSDPDQLRIGMRIKIPPRSTR